MEAIQVRAHSKTDPIFTIPGLLSPEECDAFIRKAEGIGFGDAPVTVGINSFMMAPEVRNNERVIIDDVELASELFRRLEPHIPAEWGPRIAIGLNERFRYYRYTPGQYFRWHHDGAFVRSHEERSLFTVLFYLNDDYEGGTTDFYDEETRIQPQKGMALVFEHPILHQGAPILRGTKYVLRSDIMYTRA